jgi:hypothetical protein
MNPAITARAARPIANYLRLLTKLSLLIIARHASSFLVSTNSPHTLTDGLESRLAVRVHLAPPASPSMGIEKRFDEIPLAAGLSCRS